MSVTQWSLERLTCDTCSMADSTCTSEPEVWSIVQFCWSTSLQLPVMVKAHSPSSETRSIDLECWAKPLLGGEYLVNILGIVESTNITTNVGTNIIPVHTFSGLNPNQCYNKVFPSYIVNVKCWPYTLLVHSLSQCQSALEWTHMHFVGSRTCWLKIRLQTKSQNFVCLSWINQEWWVTNILWWHTILLTHPAI